MEQSQNTPLARALETIKKLKAQLSAQQDRQAIAIIGAGLRLPGGIDTLDAYWSALAAGKNLVGTLSAQRRAPFAQRWEGLPIQGGYLEQVLGFDAAFFGISPREARALDPQHRLLLEVAWEAFEHAALPPDRLANVRTGLYLGVTGQDYRDWQQGAPDAYWATGNGHCFAAGRIAYALGLTGPTMAVDTACSSSLVALHLAAQALRAGECEVALAGGVNLVLSPRSTELVVQTRSLAPDGLCKSFDARANGFTRGEGCGVVVLKPLAQAERDGDRILAVLRGSALNQDGRSSGFTAPNVLAQTALLEAALADAGLSARDIGLIEAHGTGTSLGDPIEMEALANALGRKNGGQPLHVGSVKANIGHLEAAAGIAGVLKVIACLEHGAVPPLVHFKTLNPRIDLSGTEIKVSGALTPWDRKHGANAGVSSFGMSGTNAHVILGAHDKRALRGGKVEHFAISAKSEPALRALASRYAERLATVTDAEFAAFAYTASQGRAQHAVRACITAQNPAQAIEALRDVAQGGAYASDGVCELPRQVLALPSYPWERELFAPEHMLASASVEVEAKPHYELRFERAQLTASTQQVLLVCEDQALRTR
ncbi:MAG TPA: beta-ketoacyl synthase N-terminal-like domain-containing protein, partial [Polyangiales bacterium]